MDLVNIVKNAGIIGAGGAGFPTHAKLTAQAEYILLNGAECEPLLRVDQQLMAIYPDEIIKGFEAAGRCVGAKKALLGIKEKHKEVITLLKERIGALSLAEYMEVFELQDMYPAGDEQVLVYELTRRVVPEVSIPLKVGCVVINSETALDIYNAMNGKPVTDTFITVAGDVARAFTAQVPVGIPLKSLFELAVDDSLSNYAVIDGGPMMGAVMENIDGFVSKKSKGYILLKKDHFLIKKKSVNLERARIIGRTACEQCRMCTDLCPRYLLGHNMQPHKVMRALSYNIKDVKELSIAQLCCGCNVCELYACPVQLHPRSVNDIYKKKLAEQGYRYVLDKEDFQARSARDYRLIPTKRLVSRLGLSAFDKDAPMQQIAWRPQEIVIYLSQHIGAPARAIVSVGDSVTAGQTVGQIPEGSLGAPVHASLAGKVSQVTDKFIVIKVGV